MPKHHLDGNVSIPINETKRRYSFILPLKFRFSRRSSIADSNNEMSYIVKVLNSRLGRNCYGEWRWGGGATCQSPKTIFFLLPVLAAKKIESLLNVTEKNHSIITPKKVCRLWCCCCCCCCTNSNNNFNNNGVTLLLQQQYRC